MGRRKAAATVAGVPVEQIPDDGSPLSITTTVQKSIGSNEAEPLSEKDFEDGQWHIYRQGDEGWTYIDEREGRPYDPDLREDYGPGKYQLVPVDGKGKPILRFRSVTKIGKPAAEKGEEPESVYYPPEPEADTDEDKLPAWIRWQMQAASEERTEAKRKHQEGDLKREQWEQEARRREYEREERRERDDRGRQDREREERQSRVEQQNMMMNHLVTVLTSFMSTKGQASDNGSMNDKMLSAILTVQGDRNREHTDLRQSIEMLALLDGLRGPSVQEKADDDNDFVKTIGAVAPMLAMMRGGGGGAPDPDLIKNAVKGAFQDPAAIAQIAMEDPHTVAQTMVSAVKNNPVLESALLEAFEKQGGTE